MGFFVWGGGFGRVYKASTRNTGRPVTGEKMLFNFLLGGGGVLDGPGGLGTAGPGGKFQSG